MVTRTPKRRTVNIKCPSKARSGRMTDKNKKTIRVTKSKFTGPQKKAIEVLVQRIRMGIVPSESFKKLDALKVPMFIQNRIIDQAQETNKYASTIIKEIEREGI